MGRIPEYQRQSLASEQVGTPGVDNSGAILAQGVANAATGLGDAANSVDTVMAQRAQTLQRSAMVDLGVAMRQQRALTAARDKMMKDATIAGKLEQYKTELHALKNDTVAEYENDPVQMRKVMPDVISRYIQDTVSGEKDPYVMNGILKGIAETKTSLINSADDYSRKVEQKLVEDQVKEIGPSYVQRVTLLNGTIPEILQQHSELQNEFLETIPEQVKVLGLGTARKISDTTYNAMSKQLVAKLTNMAPEGPAGLRHLDQVKTILNTKEFRFNAHIDDVERQKLIKDVDSEYKVREAQLIEDVQDQSLSSRFALAVAKSAAVGSKDPAVLNQLRRASEDYQGKLVERMRLAEAEPNEKVKLAMKKALLTEMNKATSNEQYASTQTDKVIHAAEAAAKTAASAAKTAAKALTAAEKRQLKENQAEAFAEIDDRVFEVSQSGDKQATRDSLGTLLTDVDKLHDQGLITDKQYQSKVRKLKILAAGAVEVDPTKPGWFGTGLFGARDEKSKAEIKQETAAAKLKAMQDLEALRQDLKKSHAAKQSFAQASFKKGQNAKYAVALDKWQDEARSQPGFDSFSPAKKAKMLQRAAELAAQEVGSER